MTKNETERLLKSLSSFFEMSGDSLLDENHIFFKEVEKSCKSKDQRIINLLTKQLHDDEMCRVQSLFPITIKNHDPNWSKLYEQESKLLQDKLTKYIVEINHCGSTSVDGLPAKPIIDIFMTVKMGTSDIELKSELEKLGYGVRINHGESVVSKEKNTFKQLTQLHIKARKGYTLGGLTGQIFHLHIADSKWEDVILFRDYLRSDLQARNEYIKLKTELKNISNNDASIYNRGKSEFVKKCIDLAKKGETIK